MNVTYTKNYKDLINEIDVSESDYEKAVDRYKSISEFLAISNLTKFDPKVFTQGSFKLGTAVKPLTEEGSYDIDLVIELKTLDKKILTQEELKKLVGDVIIDYSKNNNMKFMPENGKRCWTLNYVDGHNFHVDVLPTIPNISKEINELAYTDKRHKEYKLITTNWNITNPQDYYKWFLNLSKHSEYKRKYALANKKDIEKIPDYKIKKPLQRIIQILKRHAEIMFKDKMEYKPSSIIITTLSAKAYSHLIDSNYSFDELIKIIIKNLENELDFCMGNYCVLNPVDKRENLSSKWNDDIYFNFFKQWVNQLKFDFSVNSSNLSKDEEFNMVKRSLLYNRPDTYQLQNIVNELPYHQPMKWINQIWKDVIIKCFLIKDNKIIREIQSGELISKHVNLRFIAYSNNINQYQIYWQITNTGYEAANVHQLRGDFYDSVIIEGSQVRNESTAYYGKHYVEAFLVNQNNICVGRSFPFIVNVDY